MGAVLLSAFQRATLPRAAGPVDLPDAPLARTNPMDMAFNGSGAAEIHIHGVAAEG
jgi:hypothetical protein